MAVYEINETLAVDDIIVQIEQYKMGLIDHATNGTIDSSEYVRARKLLLSMPSLSDVIPLFIKTCRTPAEFRS